MHLDTVFVTKPVSIMFFKKGIQMRFSRPNGISTAKWVFTGVSVWFSRFSRFHALIFTIFTVFTFFHVFHAYSALHSVFPRWSHVFCNVCIFQTGPFPGKNTRNRFTCFAYVYNFGLRGLWREDHWFSHLNDELLVFSYAWSRLDGSGRSRWQFFMNLHVYRSARGVYIDAGHTWA